MGIHDEVERLAKLHEAGTLTDAEFAAAKAKVIGGDQETVGKAANKAVKLGAIWGGISLVLGLAFFFFFFLPQWKSMNADMRASQQQFDQQFQKNWNNFDKQFEKPLNQNSSQDSLGQRLDQEK